jgi:hypothetical protein
MLDNMAFVLASPLLIFAGGQPKMQPARGEAQDVIGTTRAVQQGKGSGTSRNQTVIANAYRAKTAQDSAALRNDQAAIPRGDTAFRK